MNRQEAVAYQLRWQMANNRISRELRQTTLEQRFRQFIALQQTWSGRTGSVLDEDDNIVYERWARLRNAG